MSIGMNIKEIIEILELVKRRELKHNEKINKLCTAPSKSIGAMAIDEAVKYLQMFSIVISKGSLCDICKADCVESGNKYGEAEKTFQCGCFFGC